MGRASTRRNRLNSAKKEKLSKTIPFLRKGWLAQYHPQDRDALYLAIAYSIALYAAILWGIIEKDPDVHRTLLLACVATLMIMLIIRDNIIRILTDTLECIKNISVVEPNQITHASHVFNTVISLIGLLFVVDLEILNDGRWKIGGAAAYGFALGFKGLFQSFRTDKT
jgi:hypothetical protein